MRREHGRARADDEIHVAAADPVPLIMALAVGHAAVLNGHAIAERSPELRGHLPASARSPARAPGRGGRGATCGARAARTAPSCRCRSRRAAAPRESAARWPARSAPRSAALLIGGELAHRFQAEHRAPRPPRRDRGRAAAPRDERGRGSRAGGACRGRFPARAATPASAAPADAASVVMLACCRSPRPGSDCPAVSASAADAPAGVSDASHSVRNPPVRAGSACVRRASPLRSSRGGRSRPPFDSPPCRSGPQRPRATASARSSESPAAGPSSRRRPSSVSS